MSPEHLQRMQALRAEGIARHGKSPALQVPRRAAADCTIQEGSYVRVSSRDHCSLSSRMADCLCSLCRGWAMLCKLSD
jgi:hypothetical protein